MAGKGEEVASSIDAQVREAVEKLVSEIRSSVEDIREAVDQQLTAALQSVQADVKSMTLLPQIRTAIAGLEESAAPLVSAAPAGTDAATLKRAVQAVEKGKSQVDVLNGLLEQAVQFGSRAALLILRGETFSGWKGMGFSAHGGNDENVKRFNAAPGLVPQLDELLKQEHVVEWDGANIASRLGVPAPARALLVPMVIKDKVSAAIYVDAVESDDKRLDRNSIELLVFMTGLLVDTLAIRKKIPSPTLSLESGAAPAPRPTPVPVPAPAPRPTPVPVAAPRPAPAPAPAPPAAPPRQDATVAFNAAHMRDLVTAAAPAVAPAPPKPAAPARAFESSGEAERPSTQFVPPAGLQRGGGGSPATEESKKHDEARRFARLLVSEIKLYNEAKVEQGRKNRDLYERLKEDIDRSRQMYDERIGEDVRKNSNYFYDELVRVLADGNADILGL
ncbi:MAG TPA: hypothetical protein VFM36_03900 [Thermoanaerobaculia bacterium]|nr:hypothetical protein [Thermoanaerobaculia bacterium]